METLDMYLIRIAHDIEREFNEVYAPDIEISEISFSDSDDLNESLLGLNCNVKFTSPEVMFKCANKYMGGKYSIEDIIGCFGNNSYEYELPEITINLNNYDNSDYIYDCIVEDFSLGLENMIDSLSDEIEAEKKWDKGKGR